MKADQSTNPNPVTWRETDTKSKSFFIAKDLNISFPINQIEIIAPFPPKDTAAE